MADFDGENLFSTNQQNGAEAFGANFQGGTAPANFAPTEAFGANFQGEYFASTAIRIAPSVLISVIGKGQ